MSVQFSNRTTKNGLIQIIERRLNLNDGDISGDSTLLAYFTGEINLTMDEVFGFLFPKGGTWQLDDSNHTEHPIISTNIVSGQRDYVFDTDEQGNVILDFYRVMVADSSGVFREIEPVDQQTLNNNNVNTDTFIDGQNTSGVPTRYDKTGRAIFLDLIPNYNYANGLKIHINREGSYFNTGDTTKKLGFAHLHHEYFALRPAYAYARDKGLVVADKLFRDMTAMRQDIINHYGKKEKDRRGRLVPNVENNH